jgi:hypothetical protein
METSLTLTIIIAAMQVVIVVIPLSGDLSRSVGKWYGRLTLRGYLMIVCCALVAGLTVWLFNITEKQEDDSRKDLDIKLRQRDSVNAKIVTEAGISYLKEISNSRTETAEALAKYGLKYDETRKEIFKAVTGDSLRQPPEPEITICSDSGIILDSISHQNFYFTLNICNKIAPANNVNLDIYMVRLAGDSIKIVDLKPIHLVAKNTYLHLDSQLSPKINFKSNISEFMFFLLKGSYTGPTGKVHYIQRIYSYDFNLKKIGFPNYSLTEDIKNLLSRNNIYDIKLKENINSK